MRIPFPFELETPRLVLRSPSVESAAQLLDAVNSSMNDLKPWMFWAQEPFTLEQTKENCREAEEKFAAGTEHRIHIFLKDNNELIGSTGLHTINWKVPKFEIGYWVRTSRSGRGYVTESTIGLTRYCFEELGAKRVEIRSSSLNLKSCKVAERAGFQLEGTLRNDRRHVNGTLRHTRVYSLIAP